MEIKKIKQDDRKFIFEISGINEIEANTLRRSIIAETPVMAITEVEISKNDSALYDEILSHRLGLVPIKTDSKSYNLKERCTCKGKGCAKCQTTLSLEVKGPKTIYTSELKSKDPEVKSVFDNIPIVKLTGEQEIKLVATIELGKGKDHMKFSPGLVVYKHKPKIKLNNDSKLIEKYKNILPEKSLKGNKLDENSILDNNLYEAIDSISQELIKIEYSKGEFIFTIEPFGQLEPKEMLTNAINELDYKLDEFSKKLGSSKKKTIKKILKK
ncbi:DNA-directed RNA polymerase subunit D [Candidatus Woesearchaeota archaeon]|jgi:DNA-directed RNA polymerase subunit D|nr:DNA-directed RNA polymerase subunit D [Candidatus Woesearchaeota archaeon]MBT4321802.1 DNA-directed RNA polymerase subunit D [Candidatus Woesearchaeota archaeon]MBT4630810.1 DNA-directed RNA polymerase subunit D [Candidatus Woesearchaeota archaeon]